MASVLVVLWLTLRFAGVVRRVLEQPGIEFVTRISGLLLTAFTVHSWPMRSANSYGEASDRPPA
jgi:small neutral amino acid transporter SnatA (MarC family)